MFHWNGKDLSNTVYVLMGLEEMIILKREVGNTEQATLET